MIRISLTVSQEKFFENVDGRSDEGHRLPAYTCSLSSLMRLPLRLARNKRSTEKTLNMRRVIAQKLTIFSVMTAAIFAAVKLH